MRPPSATIRRSGLPPVLLAAVLLAVVAGLLLFPGTALAGAVTPETGPTKNADQINTLYKVVLVLGLAIIGLVWGVLFYSLFKYRARRGRRAPQIRGNSPLELGWTIGASVLAVAAAITAFAFLPSIRDPQASGPAGLAEARLENAATNQPSPPGGKAKALTIKVSGAQYLWRYQYPNGVVAFHDMVVPKDTTVLLDITSTDVAHSWWIPALGGKFDGLRGYTNQTWFKATKTGTFEGQCAEFCGANHAYMTAKVIVVEPPQYLAWVNEQKRLIDESRKLVQKQRKQFQSTGGGSG
jgi:cytochrome c oxidase subunit II